jgi:uncharacterized protein (DUF58 family)
LSGARIASKKATMALPLLTPPRHDAPSVDEELRALLARVRQIELTTRRAVNATAQGAYHSRYKGRGMAFSESRAYQPGDDPRSVDWNATARRSQAGDELYVKQFVEERELTLLLAVDLSGSMGTGSRARTKRQVAAEAAALLAFSALKNHDNVGLVAFTDRTELLVRPKRGRGHVLRLLREILAARPQGRGTDLVSALETVGHLSRKRAIVALFSDLLLPAPVASAADGTASKTTATTTETPAPERRTGVARAFSTLARRHDLLVIEVHDPLESALPNAGLVAVRDPETGRPALVDSGDARVRAAYAARAASDRADVRALLDRAGVERVTVSEADAVSALTRFLRRRHRRAA